MESIEPVFWTLTGAVPSTASGRQYIHISGYSLTIIRDKLIFSLGLRSPCSTQTIQPYIAVKGSISDWCLTIDDSFLSCWMLQTLQALARSTKPCQGLPWKPLCSASSICGRRGGSRTTRSSPTPTPPCSLSWKRVMRCCMAWAPSIPPSAPRSSSRLLPLLMIAMMMLEVAARKHENARHA